MVVTGEHWTAGSDRELVEGRSFQGYNGGYVVTEDSVNRLWLRVSRGQEGRL